MTASSTAARLPPRQMPPSPLRKADLSPSSARRLRRGGWKAWTGALAAFAAAALLIAFEQVVRDTVRQADLQHQITALRTEVGWRCRALRDSDPRSLCLAKLNEMDRDSAGLQVMVGALASAAPGP